MLKSDTAAKARRAQDFGNSGYHAMIIGLRAVESMLPAILVSDTPARQALREATRSVHARLESSLRLAAPDLTLSEYVQSLGRFFQAYSALEPHLERHAAALQRVGIQWLERRKLPLLQRDLAALDCAELAVPSALARAIRPRLDSLPQAMGCLYVLEGATLGGRVISLNLRRVLTVGPENGAAFFGSYGSAVHSRWQEFCAALELALPAGSERQEAAVAAVETFRLFDTCDARNESDLQ